jgi:hypothetical protein
MGDRQIHAIAPSILKRRPHWTEERPLGIIWTPRSLRRHAEYYIRKQRTIDIERKEAHERRDIEFFLSGGRLSFQLLPIWHHIIW